MSYHQVEDSIEDAINLLDRAELLANEKRDLIYNLYRFHDRFDTSFTRFRVLSILEDCHYAYQLPIEKHPNYLSHKTAFNTFNIDTGDWIPVDFSDKGFSIYVKNKMLFFEAGDAFWKKIKKGLPKADQEPPKQMALPLVFYTFLELAKQQKENIFIKRWYATFVNSILEYDLDENDGIPKAFSEWLTNENLLKIRNFAKKNPKAITLKDKIYQDDKLLALPNLKDEKQLVIKADEVAKIGFLLDFKSSLVIIEEQYKKELSYQPDFSKYELIYDFFREKLSNEWQDGTKEFGEKEGLVTFLKKVSEKAKSTEAIYHCFIVEYDFEMKMLSFNIGIQNGLILNWQNREVSPKPELQHFTESLFGFIPGKELNNNKHFATWGGWKYNIKQSKNTLLKRLDNVWMIYKKYSPKIYEHHSSSLLKWAGISDSEKLLKKRKKILNQSYNFFANEMDFKLFLACLNHKQGYQEIANKYVLETQQLLEERRASPQLKARIEQGVTYIQTNKEAYPEKTTLFSIRQKNKHT